MAGEIARIQTGDGVNHLIDYASLANKPDIAGIEADISSIEATIAAMLSALENNGIHVGGTDSSVSGTTMSLGNASVSGRTLSVDGVVSGTTLSL